MSYCKKVDYYEDDSMIHSIVVKYTYVFLMDAEIETIIFKNIAEFEKWELRNPQCDIYTVRFRKKKKYKRSSK